MKFFSAVNRTDGPYFGSLNAFEDFFMESSKSRKIKYPQAKQTLRGKGVIDGKTSFTDDEEITLTFTVNEKKLLQFVQLYHLSNVFGLVHIQDHNLFKTYMYDYIDYLKQRIKDEYYNVADASTMSEESDAFLKSVDNQFDKIIRDCDGNFFMFLKSLKITTIPQTTRTYSVSLTMIPNYNSVKYVMKYSDFYKDYFNELSRKKDNVSKMLNEIKGKYEKDNLDFNFKFVNKNMIPEGNKKEFIEDYKYTEISLEDKYVDSFEVILSNNIIPIPMQNGIPRIQNVGRAEASVTVNMNYARENLNKEFEGDGYTDDLNNLRMFSKLSSKDYYFQPSSKGQNFILDSLGLTSFFVQALANNDIESDEFQLSNISVVFMANSYSEEELKSNVNEIMESSDSEIKKAYLSGFKNLLTVIDNIKFESLVKPEFYYTDPNYEGNTGDDLSHNSLETFANGIVIFKDGDIEYTLNDYLNVFNHQFFKKKFGFNNNITIKLAGDDKNPMLKGLGPLADVLFGFYTEYHKSDYRKTKAKFEKKERVIYDKILSYLVPQMIQIRKDDKNDYVREIIFLVVFTEYIYSFLKLVDTPDPYKNLIVFDYEEDIKTGYLYKKCLQLMSIEQTDTQEGWDYNIEEIYGKQLKEEIDVIISRAKAFFEGEVFENNKTLADINKLSTKLAYKKKIIAGESRAFIETDSDEARNIEIYNKIIDFLMPFFSGFWQNCTNYFGSFEKETAKVFMSKFSLPSKIIDEAREMELEEILKPVIDTQNKRYTQALDYLFGEDYHDLTKLLRINSLSIQHNDSEDYNYKFKTGGYFWNEEHPADLFNLIFEKARSKKGTSVKSHFSLVQRIHKLATNPYSFDSQRNSKSKVDGNDEEDLIPDLNENKEEIIKQVSGMMKGFGMLYTDTYSTAEYLRNQFGWTKVAKQLIDLLVDDKESFMPVHKIEFCDTSVVTSALNDAPFISLEKTGYSNKIADISITTNRHTKIKSAIITAIDVEEILGETDYNNSNSLGDVTTVKQGKKVLNKKVFPLREGNLLRVFLGNSYSDITNVFNGTVSKLDFKNGYITIVAENFAKEVYNEEFTINTGQGGVGIFSNIFSMKNIKSKITNNAVANMYSYGDSYKSNLALMLSNNSGLNRDKISKPTIDPRKDIELNSAQNIIGLSALVSSQGIRFLDASYYSMVSSKTLATAVKAEKGTHYALFGPNTIYTQKETQFGQSRLIENIYNVDADHFFYGIGKHKKKFFNAFTRDAITIILMFVPNPLTAGVKGLKFIKVPSKLAKSISEGAIKKVLGNSVVKKAGGIGSKVVTTLTSKTIFNVFKGATVIVKNKLLDGILLDYAVASVISSIISVTTQSIGYINDKYLSKKYYKQFGFNSSSYIAGFTKIDTREVIEDSNESKAVSYSYRAKKNLGGVLNDMQRRYQGVEWDVIESGGFATLFFGRTNYEFDVYRLVNETTPEKHYDARKLYASLVDQGPLINRIINKRTMDQNMIIDLLQFFDSLNYAYLKSSVDESNKYYSKVKDSITEITYRKENKDVFRNKIYAVSGKNLISCSIVTKQDFHNAVEMEYDFSLIGEVLQEPISNTARFLFNPDADLGSYTLRSFYQLPDHFMRAKKIDPIFSKNINSEFQAREAAAGFMEKEFIEYYDGKIVITFNPEVRRGSEVIICDTVNKIFGSVVAKEVSHYFSGKEGLVTVITPGMKVESKTPTLDLSLSNIFSEIFDFLNVERGLTSDVDIVKTINDLTEISRSTASMPYIYDFGFTQYTTLGKEQKVTGKEVSAFQNATTAPLIVYPLYSNNKVLMPDEMLYNTFANDYDVVKLFFMAIESAILNTGESIGYAIETFKGSVADLVGSAVSFSSDVINNRNLALNDLKDAFEAKLVDGDIKDEFLEELGKNAFDVMGSIEKDLKVLKEFKEIFSEEESFELDTDYLTFIKPEDKPHFSKSLVIYNNLKNFSYEEYGRDEFYSKIFALAKKTVYADTICFTEFKVESNKNFEQEYKIRTIFNLYKKHYDLVPYSLDQFRAEKIKKNYNYDEFGICFSRGRIELDSYKEAVVYVNKETNKITFNEEDRNFFVVKKKCQSLNNDFGTFDIGYGFLEYQINFAHTRFGGDYDNTESDILAKTKKENLGNLINKMKSNNRSSILIGDLNFNIKQGLVPSSMKTLSIRDDIFKGYKSHSLGVTTRGGKSYDNVLENKSMNVIKKVSTDYISGLYRYDVSDHKMVIAEIDN